MKTSAPFRRQRLGCGIAAVARRCAWPLLLAALSVALLSCAKRYVEKPVIEPEAPAFEGPVTVERLRGEVFFEKFKGLRSEVNVRVLKGGKSKGSFKGAFLYHPPGAIRLVVFDPFGDTAMDMVKAGGTLQVYLPMENTVYEGLTPQIGVPPDALFSLEEGGERYTLYVLRPAPQAAGQLDLYGKFYFDRRTRRNTGMDIYSGGERFMGIVPIGFSSGAPRGMEIFFFNGFEISLELVEPEADAELPREAFAPVPHEGRAVRPLKALFADHGL